MAQRALILSLFVLTVSQKALIQTQHTVMAAVGEQAYLNCQLMKSKDVHQVTWQKILPDGESNVATYNKYSKKLVNAGFQGKVELIDAGLQNSSILIREVTEEDEGCYRCMFNTYPDGALIATTCLKLYELHGPVLHVSESNFPEEVVVTCSATGRPAPTVTLNVLNQKLNVCIDSFKNTNGTVTVNTTCLLMRSYDNSTQVECEVQVPSVPLKKDSVMIPAAQLSSEDGSKVDTGSNDADITLVIAAVVTVSISLVVLLWLLLWFLRRKQLNSPKSWCKNKEDPEVIKTPLPTVKPLMNRTPLMHEQNEQEGTRHRASSSKKMIDFIQQASSRTPRCKQKLNL
ncbi:OX-2 membrane glycoprotein-like isoform X2 [Labrus mixtus]|uniref:OX-2 membrane glycoprotein-like isoform X2 n=1 Tax=Labrus mixtus TaxID=508554 RepID=UPI0029BFBBF6|nr:OX-2 membrane glycoprotein-like isoform X2 [Labrus mixtus]